MRRALLLVTAGVVVAPAVAIADQDVAIKGSYAAVTVRVPDDWTHTTDDDNAEYFEDADGDSAGAVRITASPNGARLCVAMLGAIEGQTDIRRKDPVATVPVGWSGIEYEQGGASRAAYCYDYTLDGRSESIVLLSDAAHLDFLLTEVNRAIKSAEVDVSLASSAGSSSYTSTSTPPTEPTVVASAVTTPVAHVDDDVVRPAPIPPASPGRPTWASGSRRSSPP